MPLKHQDPKGPAKYHQGGIKDLSETPRTRYGCMTNALGIAVHGLGAGLGGLLAGYGAVALEQSLKMIPANALNSVNNALEAAANASLVEKAIVVGSALIGMALVNHFMSPSRH